MDCNKIEIELRRLLAQVDTWRQQQKVTAIEKGVALNRLQSLYVEVLEIKTTDEPILADIQSNKPEIEQPYASQIDEVEVCQADNTSSTTADTCCEESQIELQDSTNENHGHTELSEQPDQEEHQTEELIEEIELNQEQEEQEIEQAQEQEPVQTETQEQETEHTSPTSEHNESEPESEDETKPEQDTEEEIEPQQFNVQGSDTQESSTIKSNTLESSTQEASTQDPDTSKPEPTREARSPLMIFGIEVNAHTRQEMIDTLFRGNIALFNAECDKIAAMEDFEQALIYIGENYRWVPDNMTTIRFIDLIESQFENRS